MPFGIFFPFHLVNYHTGIKFLLHNDIEMEQNSESMLMLPFDEKMPMANLMPLSAENRILSSPQICPLNINEFDEVFHYNDYCIMFFYFKLRLNVISIAKAFFSDLPILAGLYDSVNKVYVNEYSPAKVVILNNSPEMRKYKIVAEIMGVSYRFINEIIIEPYKAGNVRIAPKLIEEKIENIFTNTDYDMLVQVFDSSSNLLYEETKECLIYPREVFVDVLKNKTKDWRLDLRFFLARWVSPTNVLIDRIISDAGNAKHHPIKGISNATNDAIQEEMKCIYDYLSERINYIALPLAFAEGDYHAQRVALPSTTLKNKSGNCIDLSMLLASCFEALKLHTYIILVPGHAFLKVDLRGEIVFLESTYMGGHPYYEATQKARETYYKYFTNTYQPTMKGCYEIDLEIARKSRIFPME